jgi:predicted anti-sigma-YlaC factor YlaD
MGCQYLEDLHELYLLGTLAAEDAAGVTEHLQRGCPACFENLRQATLTVYLLSQTTRPARLDPKSKSRLLRRLRKKQVPAAPYLR